MTDDKLTILYTWSEEMTKAGEGVKDKHEEDYKSIIESVKSSNTKERILAAQLIARFFKYFPAYEESAFDSIVDLCESVDVDVRKHATIAMIAICRDCKHLVSKAADILIQLFQTNQASEVNLINQSLTTLMNLDIQKFLQTFFTNFEDGTEIVRERALKFLSSKIHSVSETLLTKEVEEQLLTYSKKAMDDVTKDEFLTFIGILSKLKVAKTATGQAMIVLVIKSQADLDNDFDVKDTDSLDKFLLCTKHTIPFLSQYNRASEYVRYICTKILPHLSSLSPGTELSVLQALAEMSPYIHEDDQPGLIDISGCQQIVFDKLLEYLPLPQDSLTEVEVNNKNEEVKQDEAKQEVEVVAEGDEKVEKAAEVAAITTPQENEVESKQKQEVDIQFTHVEYLIFTLHQLGRLNPDFFTDALMSDSKNQVKARLNHLAQGCRKYTDLLSAHLRDSKNNTDLKKEENKLKSVALRTTKNISIIIKELLRRPFQFKTTVLLSCKPLTGRPAETSSSSTTNSAGNNNTNNNGANKPQANKGQQNNGNYNKSNYNRQGGQKHKYKQSYQSNSNKRPRHAR